MSESHGTAGKSSVLRIALVTAIVVFFIIGSWGVSLFFKAPTDSRATDLNAPEVFIPAWLILTLVAVGVSFWFAFKLMTLEKNRDSETAAPASPAHH